jgi:hypothetical protein
MKEYFASIGFKLIVDIMESNPTTISSIKNYKSINITNQTKLTELKFPIGVGTLIYVISFDYLV